MPNINISSSLNTICNGDSILISSNSNSNPLVYQWVYNNTNIANAINSNFIAKNNGSYKLIVTDTNGCSNTSNSINIIVNPIPVIAATLTASGPLQFCQGQTVTLTTTSNSAYNYQWMLNGTNLTGANTNSYTASTSGNYNVKVTNNTTGCFTSPNASTIVVYPLPVSTIAINGNDTICANDSVEILSTTVSLGSYQWYRNNAAISGANLPNYFAKIAGSYTLKRNNNNCVATSSPINISVKTIPTPTIFYYPNNNIIIAYGVLPTGGKYNSYQWYFNSQPIALSFNDTLIPQQNGQYYVIVGYNGCYSTSNIINVNIPTSIKTNYNSNSFLIYPNPTHGIINIKELPINGKLELYSTLGQLILSNNHSELDLSQLVPGLYKIVIKNAQNEKIGGGNVIKE